MKSLFFVVLAHPVLAGLISLLLVVWGLMTLDQKQGPIRLLAWAAVVAGAPVLILCCGIAFLAGI